jgi:hypothetical protein
MQTMLGNHEVPFDGEFDKLCQAWAEAPLHTSPISIESDLRAKFNARPHWGQRNFMNWAMTERAYPGAKRWRAIYEVANQSGVFNNPLTDQLGISKIP